MFVLTFLVAIGSFIFFYWLTSPFNYWKNRRVPHPPISFLFGNVKAAVFLKKSLGQIYCDIYKQYPALPYVGVYQVRTPCIVLRDLDLIKEVLVKNFSSFSDNGVPVNEKSDPLFSKNPFGAKGDRWKESRQQMTPSYTSKRIKEMYPLMDAVCTNMVKFIRGNSDGIDAKVLSLKYTTDVVASCSLGLEGNSFLNDKSEYIAMCKKILSPSFLLHIKLSLLFIFPSLANILHIQFVPDDVSAYFRTIVGKTLEYRTKNNVQRGDFLDAMNELKQKPGGNFTNDDVTAHVLGFFIDGTESSSIVLSFVLYELGLHPDIQTNLKDEIDKALQKNEGKLSFDSIQEMEYLDQIVNESLRKNSTGFHLTRLCTEQFQLVPPRGDAPAITVEVGTPLIIPVFGIHLDPKYHPDPSRFDPSRFSNENKDKRLKYDFMPFGEGPRTCLGQRFGISQVKVAVVNLICNFEISLSTKTKVPYEIDPHYVLLAAKSGIWLDFRKR